MEMKKEVKKLFNENPHLKVVFSKMLEYGGFDIEKFSFGSDWYFKYAWDKKEEADFRKWLEKYLTKEKGAFKEFTDSMKNPKNIKKVVEELVWNYGWKSK
jgi:hypothetical protein